MCVGGLCADYSDKMWELSADEKRGLRTPLCRTPTSELLQLAVCSLPLPPPAEHLFPNNIPLTTIFPPPPLPSRDSQVDMLDSCFQSSCTTLSQEKIERNEEFPRTQKWEELVHSGWWQHENQKSHQELELGMMEAALKDEVIIKELKELLVQDKTNSTTFMLSNLGQNIYSSDDTQAVASDGGNEEYQHGIMFSRDTDNGLLSSDKIFQKSNHIHQARLEERNMALAALCKNKMLPPLSHGRSESEITSEPLRNNLAFECFENYVQPSCTASPRNGAEVGYPLESLTNVDIPFAPEKTVMCPPDSIASLHENADEVKVEGLTSCLVSENEAALEEGEVSSSSRKSPLEEVRDINHCFPLAVMKPSGDCFSELENVVQDLAGDAISYAGGSPQLIGSHFVRFSAQPSGDDSFSLGQPLDSSSVRSECNSDSASSFDSPKKHPRRSRIAAKFLNPL